MIVNFSIIQKLTLHHQLLQMLAHKHNFIKTLIKQVILILIFVPQLVNSYVASPYFRAGSASLGAIANLSGVQSANFTITFSQPLPTVPLNMYNTSNKLIYGFKTFKTYDTLYNQSIRIIRTSTYQTLNTGFSINVTQKNNFTHIMKLQIYYMAIDYTLGYYIVAYDIYNQDQPNDTIFYAYNAINNYFSTNNWTMNNYTGTVNQGGIWGSNFYQCLSTDMVNAWKNYYSLVTGSDLLFILSIHSLGISTLTNQNTNMTQWVYPYNLSNLKFNFKAGQIYIAKSSLSFTGYPFINMLYTCYNTSISLFQFSYIVIHHNLTNPMYNPFGIQMTYQSIIINGGVDTYVSVPSVFFQNMFTSLHDFGASQSNCRLDYEFQLISNSTFSGIHFLPSTTAGTLATCALNFINQTLIIFKTYSCLTPYLLYNTVTYDCVVNCSSYFFQNSSVSQCQPCYYACVSCTASNVSTSCTACSALDNRTLINSSCQCESGYFDNMYSSNCLSCQSVNSICSACNVNLTSLSSSQIISLFSNSNWTTNILSYYTCTQCVSPYFYDSTTKQCTSCPIANCTTCQTSTICQVCSNTTVLSANGACFVCTLSSCVQCSANNFCSSCSNGYFLNNGVCVACNYSCYTCAQSTSCTACSSSQYRTLNTSTAQCVCNTGYFDNFYSGQCVSCISVDPNSLICSANLSSFTQAQLATFFANSSWATNILPYFTSNQCLSPTFYNSTTHLCQNCSSLNCSSCLNSTTCQSCQSGTVLSTNGNCYVCSGSNNCLQCNGTNVCQKCIIGYIAINGTCIACKYSCYTCTQTTTCASCLSSQFRTLNTSTSQCVCNTGYFDNFYSGQCVSCISVDPNSLICSANLSSFTQAQLATFFANSSWATNILPYFTSNQCLSPTFYNSTTHLCQNCSSLNCSSCLNSTTCQSCQPGTVLSTNGNCYVCSGSNNCLQCDGTNSCQLCIAGYTAVNGVCVICNYTCKTCSQPSICSSCLSSQFRTLNTSTSQCQCNKGYFDNEYSGQCLSCEAVDIQCLKCIVNLSNFTTVQLSAFFSNSSWPSNIVPYFTCEQISIITNCTANCSVCLNQTSCAACDSGTVLSSDGNCYICSSSLNCVQCIGTNVCQDCETSYYLFNGTCKACKYSCYTCTQSTFCTSCLSSQFRTFNNSTSQCVCNSGYFDNSYSGQCVSCISVDPNSLTCSVDLSSFTQAQLVTFFGNSSWPINILPYFIGGSCIAPTFYNSTTHLCQNCSSLNCASCLNSTTCQSCQSGTILSTNGNCYVCSGSTNCLQCNETNNCQLCMDGYIAQNGICVACKYSCYACAQATTCSSCLSSQFRTLNTSTSQCVCNTGYFDNTYSGQCISCSSVDPNSLICSANLSSFIQAQLVTFFANSSWATNILPYFTSSQCLSPTFYNSTTHLCQNCTSLNCSSCLNSITCQFCQSGTVLSTNGNCYLCSGSTNCLQCNETNICQKCIIGYVAVNGICVACKYSCYTCTQTTFCTSCLSSQFRTFNNSTSQCVCNSGYFDNSYSGQCVSCISVDPNSLTCSVDLSSFTQAQLVTFFGNSSWPINILPYFIGGSCIAPTFYNSTTHLCQNCSSLNCASCLNSTTCQSCQSGTILSTNGNCYVCSGSTNCLQCNETNNCQKCFFEFAAINGSCISCSVSCTCNGYYLPMIDNSTCTTVCGDGIIAGLQQCDFGTNNSVNGCSSNCQYQSPQLNTTLITESGSAQLSLQQVSYGSYGIFILGFCLQGVQFLGHIQTYQILTMNNTHQDLKVFESIHGFNQISSFFSDSSILFHHFNFMYIATASTAVIAFVLKLLSLLCRNSRKIGVQKKTSFQNKIEDQNNSEHTEGTVDFTVHYQKNRKNKIPLSNASSVYMQPQNNFSKISDLIIKYPLFYLSLNSLSIFSYSLLQTLKNIDQTHATMIWFYLITFTYPLILIVSLYKSIKIENEDFQNSHFSKDKCVKFYLVIIAQRIIISGLTVGVPLYNIAIVLALKTAILIYLQRLRVFKTNSQFYRSSFMNFMHFTLLSLLGFNLYYLSTSQANLNALPKNTIAYLELGVISVMALVNIAFLIKKLVKKGVQVQDEQGKNLKQSAAKLVTGHDGAQYIDQTDINFRQNEGFSLSKHLTNYMSQKSKNKIVSTNRFPLKSNRTNQLQQNYFQSNNPTNRSNFNPYKNQNQQIQPYANKQSIPTQKTIKSHRIIKKERNQANMQNHIRFSNDCQQPDDRQTIVNYKSQKQVSKVHYDKQRQKQKRSQLTMRQKDHQAQSDFDQDVDLVSINYEHEGDYNRRSMGQQNQSYRQKYSKSQKQNFKKINLQHQKRKMQRQAQRQKRRERQARNNRRQLQQKQNQHKENDQNPDQTVYKSFNRRMNRKNN